MTAAHTTADLAELVCSHFFRSDGINSAVVLLHQEMRMLGSLIMQCADANRVPVGGALAVVFKAREASKYLPHPTILKSCSKK